MAKRQNEIIIKELKRLRNRLIKINKKIKSYLEFHKESHYIIQTRTKNTPHIPKEIFLNEIHKKLYAINTYLQERIGIGPS